MTQKKLSNFQSSMIIGGFFLFLILCFRGLMTMAAPPQQSLSPPSIARGEALWLENCAPCHGTRGLGDGPVSTSSGVEMQAINFTELELARQRSLLDIFTVTKNGRIEKLMPPWQNRLNDSQIWDVTAYTWLFSVTDEALKAGARIYENNCQRCHGEAGEAVANIDFTQVDMLAAQSDQVVFDRLRLAEDAHTSLTDLSDEALWQSVAFVRTLGFDRTANTTANAEIGSSSNRSRDGVIQGTVVNGTRGNPVFGIPLILYALNSEGSPVQTYTATSDTDGRFQVTEVIQGSDFSYVVEGLYRRIAYFSEELPISTEDDVQRLDLVVYDLTNTADHILQSTLHRVLSFSPGRIDIADVHVFDNLGDETYIGDLMSDGNPGTVQVGLPPKANEVAFRVDSVRLVDGHYVEGQAIRPGEGSHSIFVTYSVPIEDDEQILETLLFYDVAEVSLVALEQGQSLESPQLLNQGTQVFQGQIFQVFTGQAVSKETGLVLNLADLGQLNFANSAETAPAVAASPAPADAGLDQTILMWSLLGLGMAMILFGLIFARRPNPVRQAISQVDLAQEKDKLLTMLIELDALRKAGEIDESTYQEERLKHRARLKQILQQQNE